MAMRVVHVGNVPVRVPQPRVPMPVRVRLAGGIARLVAMLMMRVVHVWMAVLHRFVLVFMFVPLG